MSVEDFVADEYLVYVVDVKRVYRGLIAQRPENCKVWVTLTAEFYMLQMQQAERLKTRYSARLKNMKTLP